MSLGPEFRLDDVFSVNVPPKDSDEFKAFLQHDQLPKGPYEPGPEDVILSPPNLVHRSYASFGKDGLTCSINAYGKILQICRHMGIGKSGIMAIDKSNTPEPYAFQPRASRLDEAAQRWESRYGYGLHVLNLDDVEDVTLSFVHDRWPRVAYRTRRHAFVVQMFIQDDVVIQEYSISLQSPQIPPDEDDDISRLLVLNFDLGTNITELDYHDNSHDFNDDDSWDEQCYVGHIGANGFNHILSHRLRHPLTQQGWVCAVAGVFVDGIPQTLNLSRRNRFIFDRSMKRTVITAAYKLVHVEPDVAKDWRSTSISPREANIKAALSTHVFQPVAFTADQRMDFIIRRNLEHILSVCMIPAGGSRTKGASDDSISTTGSGSEVRRPLALTCGDISGHRICISAS